MPLVKAQCPNCGGSLEVDKSLEAALCPYCNTPYIVEKAINNYNTYVVHQYDSGTVVNNIVQEESLDRLLANARALTNIGNYEKAFEVYTRITEHYPEEYNGWWGLIMTCTKGFSDAGVYCVRQSELREYYKYFKKQCADNYVSKEKEQQFKEYLERVSKNAGQALIDELKIKKDKLQEHIKFTNQTIAEKTGEKQSLSNENGIKIFKGIVVLICIIAIICSFVYELNRGIETWIAVLFSTLMSIVPAAIGFFTFLSFINNDYTSKKEIEKLKKQIEESRLKLNEYRVQLNNINSLINQGELNAERYLYIKECKNLNIKVDQDLKEYDEYDSIYKNCI